MVLEERVESHILIWQIRRKQAKWRDVMVASVNKQSNHSDLPSKERIQKLNFSDIYFFFVEKHYICRTGCDSYVFPPMALANFVSIAKFL